MERNEQEPTSTAPSESADGSPSESVSTKVIPIHRHEHKVKSAALFGGTIMLWLMAFAIVYAFALVISMGWHDGAG